MININKNYEFNFFFFSKLQDKQDKIVQTFQSCQWVKKTYHVQIH